LILKKNDRKFQGSTKLKKAVRMISTETSDNSLSFNSVTTDWKHWVVLHGSEKVVREDVRNIGDIIGVPLSETQNMFGVLARKEKGKKKSVVEGIGGSVGSVEGV
jgi:hypothetical protein